MRVLVTIPVYNEQRYVAGVLSHVLEYADDVLVIDDGSTDRTAEILAKFPVDVYRHGTNRGYGRSLVDAFAIASMRGYDWVVTMDADEQHEPMAIPAFVESAATDRFDVVSGSRYLRKTPADDLPPAERRAVNREITRELNCRFGGLLGTELTDSFCGFKAYRVESLKRLRLTEPGYAFPMQFWAQSAAARLRVTEIPITLIYNDPNRSFGAQLDDPDVRLAHYRSVLHAELAVLADRLPRSALSGITGDAGRCLR